MTYLTKSWNSWKARSPDAGRNRLQGDHAPGVAAFVSANEWATLAPEVEAMIVLGIDPGTAITGYGLVREERGALTCVRMGAVLTRAEAPLPARLCRIYRELCEVIADGRRRCCSTASGMSD